MPLPLQTLILYCATSAAVIQSRLHEPCSVYYFALFYMRQKASCSFVPPSHEIPAVRRWSVRFRSVTHAVTDCLLPLFDTDLALKTPTLTGCRRTGSRTPGNRHRSCPEPELRKVRDHSRDFPSRCGFGYTQTGGALINMVTSPTAATITARAHNGQFAPVPADRSEIITSRDHILLKLSLKYSSKNPECYHKNVDSC